MLPTEAPETPRLTVAMLYTGVGFEVVHDEPSFCPAGGAIPTPSNLEASELELWVRTSLWSPAEHFAAALPAEAPHPINAAPHQREIAGTTEVAVPE
mmetsp:Transcript_51855/g.91104  ORF Transcript_51855/g.91104 Transcript_51855/m.91104 type:complete len:97 (-) Transcript_51855:37-327(-)